MKTSEKGIKLLEEDECFCGEPYNDEAGNATIGYGDLLHLGPVTEKDKLLTISVWEAEQRLIKKLVPLENYLNTHIKVILNQNQFDALVIWSYNCGIGALSTCSWLNELNKGNYKGVPALMKLWNKIKDPKTGELIVSKGLVNRRLSEANLFMS